MTPVAREATHTLEWERTPSRLHRALFARLDTQAYVARLEQAAAAKGVDVAALKARETVHDDESDAVHALLV